MGRVISLLLCLARCCVYCEAPCPHPQFAIACMRIKTDRSKGSGLGVLEGSAVHAAGYAACSSMRMHRHACVLRQIDGGGSKGVVSALSS